MILVDANVLIYAHVRSFAQHARAKQWLDGRLAGSAQVGLPWPSLLSFLRLVTNRRVFERPESTDSAWHQVLAWLACDSVWIPQPTDRHAEVLGGVLKNVNVAAYLIPDAHLAALANRARPDALLDGWRFRAVSRSPLG
jgi:toxin-antitoxin system PIN domain toxin